jgi:hypothetical protein
MSRQLKVHTVLYDNGDGGYTGYAFNTPEEREEHRKKRSFQEVYNPDDEYENGYLGEDVIELNDEGTALAEPFCFHAGQ